MKIVLFDKIGKIGIVIGWEPIIREDYLKFEIGRNGKLNIGDKVYDTVDGVAYVPQYILNLGQSKKISFSSEDNNHFSCGTITRTGSRMISISNPIEPCIIACCQKIDEQQEEIDKLKNTVDLIKKQYGITII